MTTTYAFIDGGFLRGFIDEQKPLFQNDIGPFYLDLSRLSFDRAYFYDALPVKKTSQLEEDFSSELSMMQYVFDSIAEIDNMNMRPALTRGDKRRQKGVDIMLAIECLQHAERNNMDVAEIYTCDLDFWPLFEALSKTRVRSVLRYRPGKTADELIQMADIAKPLTVKHFASWIVDGDKILGPINHRQYETSDFVANENQFGYDERGVTICRHKSDRAYYAAIHTKETQTAFFESVSMVVGELEDTYNIFGRAGPASTR